MSLLRSVSNRIRIRLDQLLPLFYEEIHVARYITVAESIGGFTLPGELLNDRHILSIKAPGISHQVSPVIFYRTTHTGNPRFVGSLNNTPLADHHFSDGGPHAWHRILPPGTLKPESNELVFAVFNTGTVTFADVVILYTSRELTVKKPLPEPVISRP